MEQITRNHPNEFVQGSARPLSPPWLGLPGGEKNEIHPPPDPGENAAKSGVLHVEARAAALMAATTMPKPILKVAGKLRYWDDEDGAGVQCACHGARYDTPDEMVEAHRAGEVVTHKRPSE
jgi:hypothetical protein